MKSESVCPDCSCWHKYKERAQLDQNSTISFPFLNVYAKRNLTLTSHSSMEPFTSTIATFFTIAHLLLKFAIYLCFLWKQKCKVLVDYDNLLFSFMLTQSGIEMKVFIVVYKLIHCPLKACCALNSLPFRPSRFHQCLFVHRCGVLQTFFSSES